MATPGGSGQVQGLAGKCLNGSGGGTNDLLLWHCQNQNNSNEMWVLGSGDTFELALDWGGRICADANNPERAVYRGCDGSAGQQWSFGPPPSPPAPPITSVSLPGFRFWSVINGTRVATPVTICTDETVCVAGAIPSRAEAFVRIVGPKPNGYLWTNIVKFNTTATEIWIEQLSTGKIKYYYLPALPSDSATLPGLVDKTAFLP